MIRWVQDEENNDFWYGYIGKVQMFHLSAMLMIDYFRCELRFLDKDADSYSSLKSAKRGAERTFKRFLKEAGLKEVTP